MVFRIRSSRTLGLLLVALTAAGAGLSQERAVPALADARDGAPADQVADPLFDLGRSLFFDPALSRSGRIACADCHDPEYAFSDKRRFSIDEFGVTTRHSQSLVDVPAADFHWDGEFPTMRSLVLARIAPPEQAAATVRGLARKRSRESSSSESRRSGGLSGSSTGYYRFIDRSDVPRGAVRAQPLAVLDRLQLDGRHTRAFELAYRDPTPTLDRVSDALERYVRSLRSAGNAFDRHRLGDKTALDASAERGLALFEGRANCSACHTIDGDRPSLTDGAYHDTGMATRAVLRAESGEDEFDRRLRGRSLDAGRARATFRLEDRARFRTPSLRDVARRAPYMHDGSFRTLRQVIDYYDGGGTPHEGLDPEIRPLELTDAEKVDLEAFLRSLTSSERAGLANASSARPDRTRIRLTDLSDAPIANIAVRVQPTGDRVRGTDAMPDPFYVRTDDDGWLEFPFPRSTHVVLDSTGYDIANGALISETTASLTLLAMTYDTVAVPVRWERPPIEIPTTLRVRRLIQRGRKLSGKQTELQYLRELDNGWYLYVADEPAARFPGRVFVEFDETLRPPPAQQSSSQVVHIDLSGGLSPPIYLAERQRPITGVR